MRPICCPAADALHHRLLPSSPTPLPPSTKLPCSYFFDRPDDEAPDNRLQNGPGSAAAARRAAASKSFAGQLAPAGTAQQQHKGEPAVQLAYA